MASSSVPPIQWLPTGIVLPTTAAVLAGVQTDIDSAFGGGVNPALNTPQGQLATSETAIITDKNSQIAFIVNQVDPQYASGNFQDAIGQIYFLQRKSAVPTFVTATLGGVPFTVVPYGVFAQDTSGNTYMLTASVTIGSGGTVSSIWENVATGPIPCPDGTLTKIYQSVNGWDTISNPALAGPLPSATLGQYVETRAEFELRRKNSVALNSVGPMDSIYAAVFQVTGVTDCYAIDNPLGTIVDSGATNYPLAAHSLYVAVLGGNSLAVAQAIWNKKAPGCNYNGNTTETVTDTVGYNAPYPTYSVSFEIPTPLPIYFSVQIVNNPSLPANIVTLIQNAVVARFQGTDSASDAQMERIGAYIFSTRYYVAIASLGSNVQLIGVQVGDVANPTTPNFLVGIDQNPTILAANVAVTLV